MIEIAVKKDKDGICNGFLVKGHAGYDEFGKDIICSAVSVLVINTINSIETFTEDILQVRMEEESGLIEFKLTSSVSPGSRLLLDSLLLGLRGIETDYGREFISIC